MITWLGQGKADSPDVGRAGRSGDAECRAIVDTHRILQETLEGQSMTSSAAAGWVSFHTSGVPCLSCVGVTAQFKRLYPYVQVHFTFTPREHGWGDELQTSTAPSSARTPLKGAREHDATQSVVPGNGSSVQTAVAAYGVQQHRESASQFGSSAQRFY